MSDCKLSGWMLVDWWGFIQWPSDQLEAHPQAYSGIQVLSMTAPHTAVWWPQDGRIRASTSTTSIKWKFSKCITWERLIFVVQECNAKKLRLLEMGQWDLDVSGKYCTGLQNEEVQAAGSRLAWWWSAVVVARKFQELCYNDCEVP